LLNPPRVLLPPASLPVSCETTARVRPSSNILECRFCSPGRGGRKGSGRRTDTARRGVFVLRRRRGCDFDECRVQLRPAVPYSALQAGSNEFRRQRQCGPFRCSAGSPPAPRLKDASAVSSFAERRERGKQIDELALQSLARSTRRQLPHCKWHRLYVTGAGRARKCHNPAKTLLKTSPIVRLGE